VTMLCGERDRRRGRGRPQRLGLPDRAALSDGEAPFFLDRRGRRPYILASWSTRRVVPLGTRRTR
jgi:hypothetical protein